MSYNDQGHRFNVLCELFPLKVKIMAESVGLTVGELRLSIMQGKYLIDDNAELVKSNIYLPLLITLSSLTFKNDISEIEKLHANEIAKFDFLVSGYRPIFVFGCVLLGSFGVFAIYYFSKI